MKTVDTTFVDDVAVPSRHRDTDPKKVKALAASMAEFGLMNPIIIHSSDDYTQDLVAGRHRLEAAKQLGWEEIDCVFVDLDEIDRELWEIDENLMRADLTPAEEAAHLERRSELFELRKNTGTSCPTNNGRGRPKEFAQETAEKTGQSKKDINRKIARAVALGDETLNDIRGTSLDKGTEMDALAKLPEEERKPLIEKAKAGEKVSAKQAVTEDQQIDASLRKLRSAWNDAHPRAREIFMEEIR